MKLENVRVLGKLKLEREQFGLILDAVHGNRICIDRDFRGEEATTTSCRREEGKRKMREGMREGVNRGDEAKNGRRRNVDTDSGGD